MLYVFQIFSEIPFFYTDDNGDLKIIRRKAQLLSNTCDATRDKTLLFAAIHPLADIQENPSMISNITKNQRYNTFYLPDGVLENGLLMAGMTAMAAFLLIRLQLPMLW